MYTEAELEALAAGVTPEQLANRRIYDEKLRKDREKHAQDTFWTPIHPRGIITIPRSLPLGVRQLVSLILLIVYPFWFLLVITWFLIGCLWFCFLWVLFFPFRFTTKAKQRKQAAGNKKEKWDYDIMWTHIGPEPEPQLPTVDVTGKHPEYELREAPGAPPT